MAEQRIAESIENHYNRDDFILRACVKNRIKWQDVPSGASLRLVSEIMRVTGRTQEAITYQAADRWIASEMGALEAACLTVLPCVNLQTLAMCDPHEHAQYLMVGKMLFEQLYKATPWQVFGTEGVSTNKGQGILDKTPQVVEMSPQGVPTKIAEETFSWSK